LEEEKKAVENLHASAKGDVGEQTRVRMELAKRNDGLSQELTEMGRQLMETRAQLQGMTMMRQQSEGRAESVGKELLAVRAEAEKRREEAERKRKELEEVVAGLGRQLQESNAELKRSRDSEGNSQAYYV
jgi:chromosome segregation ATPase